LSVFFFLIGSNKTRTVQWIPISTVFEKGHCSNSVGKTRIRTLVKFWLYDFWIYPKNPWTIPKKEVCLYINLTHQKTSPNHQWLEMPFLGISCIVRGFLPNPQRSPLPKLLVDHCRGKANKPRHCRSVAVVSPNPPGEKPATVPEETTGFWNSLEQGRTSPKEKDCDCQICYINIYIWCAVKIYYNCLVCFWKVIVFWGGPYRFTGFCCFRHHPSSS